MPRVILTIVCLGTLFTTPGCSIPRVILSALDRGGPSLLANSRVKTWKGSVREWTWDREEKSDVVLVSLAVAAFPAGLSKDQQLAASMLPILATLEDGNLHPVPAGAFQDGTEVEVRGRLFVGQLYGTTLDGLRQFLVLDSRSGIRLVMADGG